MAEPASTIDARQRPSVTVETLTGDRLRAHLPDLARLRAIVFRAWPYLYQADDEYEGQYRGAYANSERAAMVVAASDGAVIGASTCLPLEDEAESVQLPFRAAGLDRARFCYFGESVLLPEWRGSGIGVAFFEHRERHAREVCRADWACFCAVDRPPDHPARPAGYVPLDAFWTRRGYVRHPDLACTMHWRDIGEPDETPKRLVFWLKRLEAPS